MPAIPAIIGAGGAIAGGLLGGRKSKDEKQALSNQARLSGIEAESAQYGQEKAKQIMPGAIKSWGDLTKYYGNLLGDRQSAMEAEAPIINTLVGQYDTAAKQRSEMLPRGGGAVREAAERPFNLAGLITNLLAGGRTAAAGDLQALAGQEAGTASSLLGMTGGASANLASTALASRQVSYNQGLSTGQSIAQGLLGILKSLPGKDAGSSVGLISSGGSDIPVAG